ncbi:MAG: M50 family metallopeptidase [Planctomycetes bacterium]|nr:M50 family metallopeptidase [Planctomycetota bacterium]
MASFVLAVVLALTALPLLAAWAHDTWRGAHGWPQDPVWFLAGLGGAAALVWWRRPNWLVHTFVHESCHAVACLLTGVRLREFQVSDGHGGAVLHDRTDAWRTAIIAIAPYTLPLTLAPALAAQDLARNATVRDLCSLAVGFLAVHHAHALWHNLRLNFAHRQGDLARVGRPLSLVLIACAQCATAVWVVRTMWG